MGTRDRMWRAGVGRRVAALFRAMSADVLLREQFITDPSQVLSEYVTESRLPAERAAAFNRLIYSILGNRGLFIWLRGYAVEHFGKAVSPHQFLRDFSAAATRHNGYHVMLALVRGVTEQESVPSLESLHFMIPLTMAVFGPAADGVRGEGVNNVITDMFTGLGGSTGPGTIFTSGGTVGTNDTLTFATDVHTGDTIITDHTITQLTISDTYYTLHHVGTGDTGTGTGDTGTGTGDTGTGTGDTGTGTGDTGTGTGDTGTGTGDTGTGTGDTGTGAGDTGTGTGDTGTGETGGQTFTDSSFTDVVGLTDDGNLGGFVPFSPANYAAISLVAIAQYAASLIQTGALDAAQD